MDETAVLFVVPVSSSVYVTTTTRASQDDLIHTSGVSLIQFVKSVGTGTILFDSARSQLCVGRHEGT